MQSERGANRIAYFDFLRVFATFLIIILHVASYSWYDADPGSSSWFILNGYKTLTDHAVLLFVMISGSLFLSRDIPLKKLYLKYILRIVIAFVFWSFLYALVSNYMWGIKSVFTVALTSHYHLWFLPMIAGLYICLPILRLFVRSDDIIRYFLIVSFIFTFVIPALLCLLSDFGNIQVSGYLKGQTLASYASYIRDRLDESKICMVFGYSFYFISGYYLNRTSLEKKTRYIIYALGILGFLVTFAMSALDSFVKETPSDTYHQNFNVSVMICTIATFLLFKHIIIEEKENRFRFFISRLSKYSFGAFLIHAMIIEQLDLRLGINALSFSPVLSVPVIGIATFAVSFAISSLLNKIPFINRYIV